MSETVVTTTKRPTLSKTNITAALLALFSLLQLFNFIPESFDAANAASSLVLIGSLAVIYFRTYATQLLSRITR